MPARRSAATHPTAAHPTATHPTTATCYGRRTPAGAKPTASIHTGSGRLHPA